MKEKVKEKEKAERGHEHPNILCVTKEKKLFCSFSTEVTHALDRSDMSYEGLNPTMHLLLA